MRYWWIALVVGCGNAPLAESSADLAGACEPPPKTGPECAPIVGTAAFTANGGKVTPGSVRCQEMDGTTWDFVGVDKIHYVTKEDPPGLNTLLCFLTPDGGKP